MPKIRNNEILDSDRLVANGESNISDEHWKKLHGNKEKELLSKMKISKDNRKIKKVKTWEEIF